MVGPYMGPQVAPVQSGPAPYGPRGIATPVRGNAWQNIPTSAIREAERQKTNEDWGSQWRNRLTQMWRQSQIEETVRQVPETAQWLGQQATTGLQSIGQALTPQATPQAIGQPSGTTNAIGGFQAPPTPGPMLPPNPETLTVPAISRLPGQVITQTLDVMGIPEYVLANLLDQEVAKIRATAAGTYKSTPQEEAQQALENIKAGLTRERRGTYHDVAVSAGASEPVAWGAELVGGALTPVGVTEAAAFGTRAVGGALGRTVGKATGAAKAASAVKALPPKAPENRVYYEMYRKELQETQRTGTLVENVRRGIKEAWTDTDAWMKEREDKITQLMQGTLPDNYRPYMLKREEAGAPAQARQIVDRTIGPALETVGPEDRLNLSTLLTQRNHVEIVKQVAERVHAEELAKPLPITLTARNIPAQESRIRMLQRHLATATTGGNAGKVAQYRSTIATEQAKLAKMQTRVAQSTAKATSARDARATAARADVHANRLLPGDQRLANAERGITAMKAEVGPQRWARLQQGEQQVRQAVEWSRQQFLDSGAWSQETYDYMKIHYPNYVPERILQYMNEGTGPRAFRGGGEGARRAIGNSQDTLQRLTVGGTKLDEEDPIHSVYRMVQTAANVGAKQDTVTAMLNLRSLDPDLQGLIREVTPKAPLNPAKEVPVHALVNGEDTVWAVDNVNAALIGMVPRQMPDLGALTRGMMVYRSLKTSKDIAFAIGQMPMDFLNYVVRESGNSGGPQHLPGIIRDYFSAMSDAFSGLASGKYRGSTRQLLEAKGGLFGHIQSTPRAVAEEVERLGWRGTLGVDLANPNWKRQLAQSIVTLEPISAVAERAEFTPRVATFRRSLARGESEAQAALRARDLIDFSLGGWASKMANSLIPFFNVGVQGLAMPWRAFRQNPKAFTATAAAVLGVPGILQELWNQGYGVRAGAEYYRQNGQPDKAAEMDKLADQMRADWADVPEAQKAQGFNWMIPGLAPQDAQGNRHPQMIPIRAREWSPFITASREAAAALIKTTEGRLGVQRPDQYNPGVIELAKQAFLNSSPIQSASSETFGSNVEAAFLPPGIRQAFEIGQNKNLYTGSRIATQRTNEQAAGSAQAIAQIGKATGVSPEAQPAHVQYLLSQLGGGPAQMAFSTEAAAEGKPSTYQAGAARFPVAGQVAKRFIRGDIGGQLEMARDAADNGEAAKILEKGGVTYRPEPTDYELDGARLTIAEQALYQQTFNAEYDREMRDIAQLPDWDKDTVDGRTTQAKARAEDARNAAKIALRHHIGLDNLAKRATTAGGQ